MEVQSIQKNPNGIVIGTDEGMLKIEVVSAAIFHIVYTMAPQFSGKESLMVLPGAAIKTAWNMTETAAQIVLQTDLMQLVIDKKTTAFAYLDHNGALLTREPERGGKTLMPVDVVKTVFPENETIVNEMSVDGLRARAENFQKVIDRKAYHTKLEFEWQENEALYGLGSHEEGLMNLRGQHRYMYQQNMKAVVPMLVSTKGYGILVDSYSLMTFHDDVYGSYLWTDVDDEMDYYFLYGPGFDQIIAGFRHLTGKAPLLPRWAFGYVQSKERYQTQDELLAVVREYRRRGLPLDLIVLDWKSWTGELWGQKSFAPERFPDPEQMMRELHELGTRLMISIWPTMQQGGENYREMRENHFLLGNQTTYDAFNEKARELYWNQAERGLFAKGIDAWWCDCSEPFEADWKGKLKPEPEERLQINTGEAKKYLDPEYINAYSLLHSKGIYEGQRKTGETKRVLNLTRSSYAGQHRYATVTWSGDIAATWTTLRRQIAEGLNFCVTGEPYWTLDIGAFFAGGKKMWSRWCDDPGIPAPWFLAGDYDDGCNDWGYRELYVRWFQYGAFLPMFRAHGTDTPREIWRFGEPGTIFYDTLAKFDYLRYRLLPYIYSLAGWVTHHDYTMMRALPFDFQNDPNTYNINDQYLFGPAFLVCPVTRPMYYGKNSQKLEVAEKTRSVYLPEGCIWYDFWTGMGYEGGQMIAAPAPLEIMPLFVRAGAIVPLGPIIQHTGALHDAPLELRIYPGADGCFRLYEDEGDNYNYEKGDYSIIRIKWNDRQRQLEIKERLGSFRGMVAKREFRVVLVSECNGTGVDPEMKYAQTVVYVGQPVVVDLK